MAGRRRTKREAAGSPGTWLLLCQPMIRNYLKLSLPLTSSRLSWGGTSRRLCPPQPPSGSTCDHTSCRLPRWLRSTASCRQPRATRWEPPATSGRKPLRLTSIPISCSFLCLVVFYLVTQNGPHSHFEADPPTRVQK